MLADSKRAIARLRYAAQRPAKATDRGDVLRCPGKPAITQLARCRTAFQGRPTSRSRLGSASMRIPGRSMRCPRADYRPSALRWNHRCLTTMIRRLSEPPLEQARCRFTIAAKVRIFEMMLSFVCPSTDAITSFPRSCCLGYARDRTPHRQRRARQR